MATGPSFSSPLRYGVSIGGLKWNSGDCFEFCLPIIRLYPHASASCHIVRDEWWPAAAVADDSPPHNGLVGGKMNTPRLRRGGGIASSSIIFTCIGTPIYRGYFQHAHFIPIVGVGVGKRGEY